MEQQNHSLPSTEEENQNAAMLAQDVEEDSKLLIKVRQNFMVFGNVSMIFGAAFTFFFYKANLGLNVFLFTLVMVGLLAVTIQKLELPMKKVTLCGLIAVVLLSLSTMLTSSEILQFLNIVGILLLLDLVLLHQFYEDTQWDLVNHVKHMLLLPFTCLATISMPFADVYGALKQSKYLKYKALSNVLIGLVISIPLLGVIMWLLSSADLIFGKMTHEIYSFIFSSHVFYIAIMFIFGFIACYCIICGAVMKVGIGEKYKTAKKADASIAITILVMLVLVYLMFCGIQLVYLFSDGLFVLPKEFTFAEYARRGFFELLAVTIINILLMVICTTWFKESKWIQTLLTLMTVCTYIMIGSAVYRMLLYIGYYDLSILRLFVLLFLLIDSFILAGVIYSVYHKKFPLFGYCVFVFSIGYIIFSFSKPDYFIAYYNIKHTEDSSTLDWSYLTEELSLDAAPVVLPLIEEERSTIKENTAYQIDNYDETWQKEDINFFAENYYERIERESKERGFKDFNVAAFSASKFVDQENRN